MPPSPGPLKHKGKLGVPLSDRRSLGFFGGNQVEGAVTNHNER